MAKSSTSRESRKVSTPAKPHDGFPLFAHASGRWAKKVLGKLYYFGRWGNSVQGEMHPVDDTDATAAKALDEFNRQWPYIREGRTPPPIDAGVGCTIRNLCNTFLSSKKSKVETGELSQYSFSEYMRTTDAIVEFFGRDRRVDDLRPDDFEKFRVYLAKGKNGGACGPVTLKSKINRARVVFKFASDRQLIDRPVAYGGAFDRPSAKTLQQARNKAGERMFERADLLKILDVLDGKPVHVEDGKDPVILPRSATMKAMVLLGLNGGFGNTDVATLPRSAVNLDTGWITFPRPKTAVQRRVPLWPETVLAMRAALAERTEPIDEADADLCFITSRGTRYVRVQPSGTEGRHVTINALSRRFEGIMSKLKITGRRGLNFYTLRHVFETQAGESLDQVAVDAVMGHRDGSMAAEYRERISDERLKSVVETVRAWLFGAEGGAA